MDLDKSPEKISKMFDDIAENYDKNNDIISLGLHRVVKKLFLKDLNINNDSYILDLCCGTGDMSKYVLKIYPDTNIVGVDLSDKMLNIARLKNKDNIKFIKADACDLPFCDNSFDAIIMSFGLRNIENRLEAIKECKRVLKKGGKLLHADFGNKNVFSTLFNFIALSGIKLFGQNLQPYKYLINSKNAFPEPKKLIREFEADGFTLKCRKDYLFSIITSEVFIK